MEHQSLKLFGLSHQEIDVYVDLVRLGSPRVRDLLGKIKLNRSVLYSVLHSLEEKGFCSREIRNGVTHFKAVEPSLLISKYHANENLLKRDLEQIKSLVKSQTKKPKINILHGYEGTIMLLRDILNSKQEVLVLGEEQRYGELIELYVKQYLASIDEFNIKERVLMKYGLKEKVKVKNSEARYLPKGHESPTTTVIYGDKVIITFWYDPVTFIWIDDENLAESQRNYFELLWKIAKP